MSPAQRRKRFDARRSEVICAGAVILEQLVRHLGIESVTAVQRGLREGILVDLIRRRASGEDHSLYEAALVVGRRFHFDEAHATQVTRLGLQLFDDLAPLHNLPASARPLLEVAALLHDVGNAVSYQKHHRHSYYLIVNAEIPGLRERERELVARIARYHRRSPPDPSHSGMEGLAPGEVRLVRKLSTLLRVADSLDRSHRQSIVRLQARLVSGSVLLKLRARSPLDLELWDATHEAGLFRRVFGRRLQFQVLRQPQQVHRRPMRAAAYLAIDPRFR
jgi:exopolyphosphatase/guanosine-5'-triphosphate,3'-diphosphate pyrophosphatase